MRLFLLLIVLTGLSAHTTADNRELLDELDATIERRPQYIKSKENRIRALRNKLATEKDSVSALKTVNDLYSEFYVYNFDSARTYANHGLDIAIRQHNDYYTQWFTVRLAETQAIGGLYTEAVNTLNSIHPESDDRQLCFKYYFTYFRTYSYWSDYCHDQIFSPRYRQQASDYLKRAMQYADSEDAHHTFFQGEVSVYVAPDSQRARAHYHHTLNTTPEESRLYAMAAFALAGNYKEAGDLDKYEEYLIRSALSDLKACTMENMAMQALAVHLFQQSDDDLERAERYIKLSMEDAKRYNNRLRILEISRILPQIMSAYQEKIQWQNSHLFWLLLLFSLLLFGLLFAIYYIYRQNRKLTMQKGQLADSYHQLTDLSQQQQTLNGQLKLLNQRLVDTNRRREGLASIYIDLCAQYIDKLCKYQTLVKRKIKAHQEQELLQTMTATRISEQDAATFLHRFDKAFLELYPTFIDEFNALLQPDNRIQQKTPMEQTTELRIFALIRLGVKNTSDIAGLLFLSPQTIYNCRSVIKNKAISKETFDKDVLKLCSVI